MHLDSGNSPDDMDHLVCELTRSTGWRTRHGWARLQVFHPPAPDSSSGSGSPMPAWHGAAGHRSFMMGRDQKPSIRGVWDDKHPGGESRQLLMPHKFLTRNA